MPDGHNGNEGNEGNGMELHESLAELARDHPQVFREASAFRGALDDYLDEGTASAGTINLLTDAVRLGALDQLVQMLDSGASAESAVETAGQRLARDRGSRDVLGSQWACSVLGFALGRVSGDLVTRLAPDAETRQPPYDGATAVRPAAPPPPPVTSPMGPPPPGGQPGWVAHPPPRKSRTGLVIGLVAAALVVIIGVVVTVVALSAGGDDDPSADDTASSTAEETSDEPSETDETEPTETEDTDLSDGLTVYGTGYVFDLPEGWTDGLDELGSAPETSKVDTFSLWGDDLASARSNIIVERESSYGEDDPADLKERWTTTLMGGIESVAQNGADLTDVDDIEIGGESAVGVQVEYQNQYSVEIRQVAYLTVHEGNQFSIAVTIVNDDEDAEPVFEDALDTWVWAD
jgi:hypothetical protein